MRPAIGALAVLGCSLEPVAGAPAAITTVSVAKIQTTPSHVTLVSSPSKSADKSSVSTIYPSSATGDAPYSVPESTLLKALSFPEGSDNRTTADKLVIFIHGLGIDPGVLYASAPENTLPHYNSMTLLLEEQLLGDAQISAEYIAFAINHVSTMNQNRTVAVVAFSEANLAAQWAYKYWPSIRSRVSDHIGISANYAGSNVDAVPVDPPVPDDSDVYGEEDGEDHSWRDEAEDTLSDGWDALKHEVGGWFDHDNQDVDDNDHDDEHSHNAAMPPIRYQMKSTSNFVRKLRADGGDAAFVPTTNIYSSLDGILHPQSGFHATGRLNASRPDAPVTNVDIRQACPDGAPGLDLTHFGVAGHSLTLALLADALSHDGPGLLSRVDRKATCGSYNLISYDGLEDMYRDYWRQISPNNVLSFQNFTREEPPIKNYARMISADHA